MWKKSEEDGRIQIDMQGGGRKRISLIGIFTLAMEIHFQTTAESRWAYRRHPNKSAWWISEKYWHLSQGQWTFKTTNGIQLRQHSATAIRRYTKVAGRRSPYDGDWVYWASRLGRHPETPRKWGILLKRQNGQCSWCGLYFKQGEDLVELDHIIPKSQGGDGKTANLQLLHGHCHDVKTAQDQAVGGTRDQSHRTEEPCESKGTCTVLKPSQRG